jgi:hypothetical protein
MKVIIAGSRSITGIQFVNDAIQQSGFEITEVVSGKAFGFRAVWNARHEIPYSR